MGSMEETEERVLRRLSCKWGDTWGDTCGELSLPVPSFGKKCASDKSARLLRRGFFYGLVVMSS